MKKTELALRQLGLENFSDHMSAATANSFFRAYEAGKIDDAAFIHSVQSVAPRSSTDREVVEAWNALLLDFPVERLELLKELKKKYRLFLLSNTNAIHHRQFQQQLYDQTGSYLETFFEKAYYSHMIGLCKPDVACYQFVVEENKLNPAETLFVDDSAINVEGARQAGLSVLHITADKTIMDIEW